MHQPLQSNFREFQVFVFYELLLKVLVLLLKSLKPIYAFTKISIHYGSTVLKNTFTLINFFSLIKKADYIFRSALFVREG